MNQEGPPLFDIECESHLRFEAAARALGMDPGDRWANGYVAYEWGHLRLALQAYGVAVAEQDVLEFGCNVGGSAVVLAALGAHVSGVDSDPQMPPIARDNLARYGLAGSIDGVVAGQPLPFAAASFDLIVANSVLDYVDPDHLPATLAEFGRVLRPGGHLLICGTASSLRLRELHSRRWFVNFVPRWIDTLLGQWLQRGLSPLRLAAAARGQFVEAGDWRQWLAARRLIHGRTSLAIRFCAITGRLFSRSPGWFAPTIELYLRKS